MGNEIKKLTHATNPEINITAADMFYGRSYAKLLAREDMELYRKYNIGDTAEFSEHQLRNMEVLNVLEKLGYPQTELGTYLYKELVMSAFDKIKDFNRKIDKDKAEDLLKEMNDAFSSFYVQVARDDMEIGVKSFHLYIGKAIDRIDESKIDSQLAEKIFGKNPVESNYGVQAFKIASYLSKKYMIKYNGRKVKRLANMPDDIKLKD